MSRLRAGPGGDGTPSLLLLPVNEELMETKLEARPSPPSNPKNIELVHLAGAQTVARGQKPDSNPPSHWISKLVCPEPLSCCFRNIRMTLSLSLVAGGRPFTVCSSYSVQLPRPHHLVCSELPHWPQVFCFRILVENEISSYLDLGSGHTFPLSLSQCIRGEISYPIFTRP